MATLVTHTLRSSGGDYTTMSAWEAGEQRDLVALDEQEVLECYNDWPGGLVDSVNVAGWTTDATRYIRVMTPVTERHTGIPQTGFFIQKGLAWVPLIGLHADYMVLEGLDVINTDSNGTGITLGGASSVKVESCICKGGRHGFESFSSVSFKHYLRNCLAYECSVGFMLWSTAARLSSHLHSCTAVDCSGTGFASNVLYVPDTVYYKNCLGAGNGTDFNLHVSNNVAYCASADATADDAGGTGNRINQTFTFEDAANDDYHLASTDAGAIGYGTDLSSDPDYPFSDDVDGDTRAAPWDIGFDQYAATGSSAALTGTATSSISESDIVTGGKTIILTLTGDTWVAAGATFDAQRQNVIDGLDSAQTETLGWNNEVRDKEVVTSVARTSDTVVTITLTAGAAYDITAQETITATIPATALVTSASAVVAAPTFTVDFVAGVALVLQPLNQSQSFGSPVLTQANSIFSNLISQSQILSNITLTQGSNVTPNSIEQLHSFDSPVITQHSVISAEAIGQLQSIGPPTLTQAHILTAETIGQLQSIGPPTLTQKNIVYPGGLNQSQSLQGVSLSIAASIIAQAVQQGQGYGSPTLQQHGQITPEGSSQGQTYSSPTIGGVAQITIHGMGQQQEISLPTLTTHSVLSSDQILQSQSLDESILLVSGVLVGDTMTQSQSLDAPLLVQNNVLLVDALLQSQELEQITLSVSAAISVADVGQLQVIDSPALTEYGVLAVESLTQSQILEIIGLGGAVLGRISGRLVLYTKVEGSVIIEEVITGKVTIN